MYSTNHENIGFSKKSENIQFRNYSEIADFPNVIIEFGSLCLNFDADVGQVARQKRPQNWARLCD